MSSGDESRQGSKANDNEDDAEFENADIDAVPVDGEVGGAADNEVQSERSDATESRISTTEPEPDARDNDSTISETVANEPHVLGDLQSQTSNVLSGSGDRSDTDDEIVIGRRKKSQRMVEKESRKMRRARIRSYYGAGNFFIFLVRCYTICFANPLGPCHHHRPLPHNCHLRPTNKSDQAIEHALFR